MRRQDVVTVQNFTKTVGGIGQAKYTTPNGKPVKVPCNVYPLTAAESEAFGLQLIETQSIVCDAWPGNVHSRITYQGEAWDQVGPVKTFSKTFGVRSVQLVIQKRG